MKWFWGLLILLLGIFFLGANFDLWSYSAFINWWQFWPVVIILLGIAVLVRRWEFGWVAILASFILAGSFLAFVVKNPEKFHLKTVDLASDEVREYPISEKAPDNIKSAEILIDTGAISLNLNADSSDLLQGSLRSNLYAPEISRATENEKSVVRLKTSDATMPHLFRLKNDLSLSMTNTLPVSLSINSGASSMNLDLSKAKLSGLNINTGASSLDIKLGSDVQDGAKLVIKAGVSSINTTVPSTIGVKINASSDLSSRSFEGFDRLSANSFQSRNYDSASKKIDLNFEIGVSSISVKIEG